MLPDALKKKLKTRTSGYARSDSLRTNDYMILETSIEKDIFRRVFSKNVRDITSYIVSTHFHINCILT